MFQTDSSEDPGFASLFCSWFRAFLSHKLYFTKIIQFVNEYWKAGLYWSWFHEGTVLTLFSWIGSNDYYDLLYLLSFLNSMTWKSFHKFLICVFVAVCMQKKGVLKWKEKWFQYWILEIRNGLIFCEKVKKIIYIY